MFPIFTKKDELSSYNFVKILKKVVRSNKSSRVYYLVLLCNESEDEELHVDRFDTSETARMFAEKTAKTLKYGIIDESIRTKTVRKCDELDMSIRDLAEKYNKTYSLSDAGEMPPSLGKFVELKDNNLSVKFPPNILSKFGAIIIIVFILVSIVPIIPILIITMKSGSNIPTAFFVAIFILPIPIGITVLVALMKKFKRFGEMTDLYAKSRSLSITYGKDEYQWSSKEIEELVLEDSGIEQPLPEFIRNIGLPGTGGIVLRSDKMCCRFCSRLNKEEKEWVYKTLYAILAGEEGIKETENGF